MFMPVVYYYVKVFSLKVEVDDSRHILYTLSDRGTVTVYDLGADGKSTSRVVCVPHNNIMNAALQVAK